MADVEVVSAASSLQSILHHMDTGRGGTGMMNVPGIYRMRGKLDHEALSRAMTEVATRHEALRTVLAERPGPDGKPELVQIVHPPRPREIPVVDINGEAAIDTEAAIERAITVSTSTDIPVESQSPFAAELYRLADDDHIFIFNVSHYVTDAWSNVLIYRDLASCYNRQVSAPAFDETGADADDLPPVEWQYREFVAWEREHLRERGRDHRRHWTGELRGLESLALRPAPARARGAAVPGENVWFDLVPEQIDALTALAQRHATDLPVVLHAVFISVLHQATGRTDLPIGSVLANRVREEVRQTVGLFANMVVLRARLDKAPTFADVLEETRRVHDAARDHQAFPFGRTVRLAPLGCNPATTVFHMLAVPPDAPPPGAARFHDLQVDPIRITEGPGSRFDMELVIVTHARGLDGLFRYAGDQFPRAHVQQLADAFTALVHRILHDTDSPQLRTLV